MRLPHFAKLHLNIATDVWPNGATLGCQKCGAARAATSEECGRYLASGWPTCCGATMSIVTQTADRA